MPLHRDAKGAWENRDIGRRDSPLSPFHSRLQVASWPLVSALKSHPWDPKCGLNVFTDHEASIMQTRPCRTSPDPFQILVPWAILFENFENKTGPPCPTGMGTELQFGVRRGLSWGCRGGSVGYRLSASQAP